MYCHLQISAGYVQVEKGLYSLECSIGKTKTISLVDFMVMHIPDETFHNVQCSGSHAERSLDGLDLDFPGLKYSIV